jgi:hypothetical protein
MTPFFGQRVRRGRVRDPRRRLHDLPEQVLRDIGLMDWGRPR